MKIKAVEALSRLRSVKTTPSVWDELPYTRRAAVLVTLFRNNCGDLSSILTIRSPELSSYSGQAALPGGKADDASETPYQISRRETEEEIGLTANDDVLLSQGYCMEHLVTLPAYLSRNLLAVRPTIAFLGRKNKRLKETKPGGADENNSVIDFIEDIFPNDLYSKYNHKVDLPGIVNLHGFVSSEVCEVFSVPLHNFLSNDPSSYTGKHIDWGGLTWNQHWFKTIRRQKTVGELGWLSVWGLTANILVDTAILAYGEEAPMPHRQKGQVGDEQIIRALFELGKLPEKIDKKADLSMKFKDVFGADSPLLAMRSV